jgi:hypothetical protein
MKKQAKGKYPKNAAGLAECAFDDLQNNACFREYCEADPIKRRADALQRLESCPATVSTVACFPNATACIPMSNGIGADGKPVQGFKPTVQTVLGLRTTTLEKTLQTTINVMRVGAMLASVISPNKPESCISSEVVSTHAKVIRNFSPTPPKTSFTLALSFV